MERILTKAVIIIGSIVAFVLILACLLLLGIFLVPLLPFFLLVWCLCVILPAKHRPLPLEPSMN